VSVMTHSRAEQDGTGASGVAVGVEVTGDFSCCLSKRIPPREQWKFLGRQTHWGHVFLVWTLIGNPRGRDEIGKRFVRWVK
jgi:hypothetical protein